MHQGIMQDKSDVSDGWPGSVRKKGQLLAMVQSPRILWKESVLPWGQDLSSEPMRLGNTGSNGYSQDGNNYAKTMVFASRW